MSPELGRGLSRGPAGLGMHRSSTSSSSDTLSVDSGQSRQDGIYASSLLTLSTTGQNPVSDFFCI